jgi:hypothetical protein
MVNDVVAARVVKAERERDVNQASFAVWCRSSVGVDPCSTQLAGINCALIGLVWTIRVKAGFEG